MVPIYYMSRPPPRCNDITDISWFSELQNTVIVFPKLQCLPLFLHQFSSLNIYANHDHFTVWHWRALGKVDTSLDKITDLMRQVLTEINTFFITLEWCAVNPLVLAYIFPIRSLHCIFLLLIRTFTFSLRESQKHASKIHGFSEQNTHSRFLSCSESIYRTIFEKWKAFILNHSTSFFIIWSELFISSIQ